MLALPSTPDIGHFHTIGRDDGFKLPVFERHRDCEILIEGPQNMVSKSSWLAIGLAATELNMACLDNEARTAGGTTFTGEADRIKITLRGVAGRVGNSSSQAVARS